MILGWVHLDDEEAEVRNALLGDAAGIGDAAGFGVGPAGGDETGGVVAGGLVDVAIGFKEVRVVFFGVCGVESGGGVLPDVGHRDACLVHLFDQFFCGKGTAMIVVWRVGAGIFDDVGGVGVGVDSEVLAVGLEVFDQLAHFWSLADRIADK